jgi:hypothetical protein
MEAKRIRLTRLIIKRNRENFLSHTLTLLVYSLALITYVDLFISLVLHPILIPHRTDHLLDNIIFINLPALRFRYRLHSIDK